MRASSADPIAAQRLIDHVTSVARADGLELHLDRAQRANTADAHRLLWWTLRTAGAAAQNDLNEALMAAYFCDGEDLGDHDVLVACAARCGLDDVAARQALADEEGLEALAVGLRAGRRPRDHCRADVRRQLALEHPRRPGGAVLRQGVRADGDA